MVDYTSFRKFSLVASFLLYTITVAGFAWTVYGRWSGLNSGSRHDAETILALAICVMVVALGPRTRLLVPLLASVLVHRLMALAVQSIK